MALKELLEDFEKSKNPAKAKILSGFFKTGIGQYGEGDIFLGLTVPQQRILAKKHQALNLDEIQKLLSSKIHEHRLTALIILTYQYEVAGKLKNEKEKEEIKKGIFDFYLSNTKSINNWDLVDVTCPNIIGEFLFGKKNERKILYNLARSTHLWEKRIAIVSTLYFIRKKDLADTLSISEILMNDTHDLIHKAVGWMLREVGKQDEKTLKSFLDKHARIMPRTMLRYSIEKLSAADKLHYMGMKTALR